MSSGSSTVDGCIDSIINDHGNETTIEVGDDAITSRTLPTHAASLRGLNGHFASGAFLHLQHCDAGQTAT
jgi:hypothetical protein